MLQVYFTDSIVTKLYLVFEIFKTQNAFQLLPKEHFSPEDWNLHSIQAIHVLHTKWACAFAFTTDRERRKVVFSGDTMPSNNLEERANGADLLIHECTLEDGMEVFGDWAVRI